MVGRRASVTVIGARGRCGGADQDDAGGRAGWRGWGAGADTDAWSGRTTAFNDVRLATPGFTQCPSAFGDLAKYRHATAEGVQELWGAWFMRLGDAIIPSARHRRWRPGRGHRRIGADYACGPARPFSTAALNRLHAARCNPPGRPARIARNRCTAGRSPCACAWRRPRWHPRGRPGCTWCSRCNRLPRSRPPVGEMGAAAAVIWARRHLQHLRQRPRARIAAGRAVIDRGLALGHRLRIGATAVEPALAALGLRQQAVQTFDQRGERGGHCAACQCSCWPRYQRCCASASIGRSSRLSPYACTQSYCASA